MPWSGVLDVIPNVVPTFFVEILFLSMVLPPASVMVYSPRRLVRRLIMLLSVVRLNPDAPADTVIADPGAHPCRVQYKNSLAAVSQFITSFNSLLNASKEKPCDSKYLPYPVRKSTTSCEVRNTVPYVTTVAVVANC